MSRIYVFADEAGNFDYRVRQGASAYFILGTVTMNDAEVGGRLLALRRELAMQGAGLESTFHATEDPQVVRDAVFSALQDEAFRADFTIFEKRKTLPRLQSEAAFYKLAWFEHFKHVGPKIARGKKEMLVVASSLGTKKKRRTFRIGIEDVVNQVTGVGQWEVAFWSCESDPCLQVADYCTWAVQRKWEQGDDRSYKLIKDKIATEYDFFKWGSKYYY